MLFYENNSYAVVPITDTTVGHSSKEGYFWLQCSGFIHLYVFQVHPCYSMYQHLIFFYSGVFSTAWIIHLAYLNIWTVSLLLCLLLWVLVPKFLVAHPFWQCWGITSCQANTLPLSCTPNPEHLLSVLLSLYFRVNCWSKFSSFLEYCQTLSPWQHYLTHSLTVVHRFGFPSILSTLFPPLIFPRTHQDNLSLCSPGCPGAPFVDPTVLKLRDTLASASWVLG